MISHKWIVFFSLLTILIAGVIMAADFTPQGNINLRDVYNITNVPYYNGTTINVTGNITALYFIGNGSQLTGISATSSEWNANYSLFLLVQSLTTNNTFYDADNPAGYITFAQAGNGTLFYSNQWNATNSSYRLNSNHSFLGSGVGIKTSSPTGILDIFTGNGGVNGNLATLPNGSLTFFNFGGSTSVPVIGGKSNDSNGLTLLAGTNDATTAGDMVFNIRENDNTDFSTITGSGFIWRRFSTELMRLTRDGNLGIGTISPVTKVDVNGTIYVKPTADTNTGISIARNSATGRSQIVLGNESLSSVVGGSFGEIWRFGMTAGGLNDFTFYDGTRNYVYLNRTSNDVYLVQSGGRVGVGTTTPQHTLNVVGSGNVTGTLYSMSNKNLTIPYDFTTNNTFAQLSQLNNGTYVISSVLNNGSYFNGASVSWGDIGNGTVVFATTLNNGSYFNSPSSGDISSVNTTLDYFLYNGSDNGDVYLRFNETRLNLSTYTLLSVLNNGTYSAVDTDTFAPNYSAFLNKVNWADVNNGTITANEALWNANYSDFLTTKALTTNGTFYLGTNPSNYINWATATNGTLALMSNLSSYTLLSVLNNGSYVNTNLVNWADVNNGTISDVNKVSWANVGNGTLVLTTTLNNGTYANNPNWDTAFTLATNNTFAQLTGANFSGLLNTTNDIFSRHTLNLTTSYYLGTNGTFYLASNPSSYTTLPLIWNSLGNGTMATTSYVDTQNTSQTNHINTKRDTSNFSFTSNVNVTSANNITIGNTGGRFCFSWDCSSYIYNNGTHGIWK